MNTFKNFKKGLALILLVAGMSSCIGTFSLTHKVLDWNRTVSNKFVNELVFIGFHIVPVYQVTILADALVLNSIEFWGGNPNLALQEGESKMIENQGRVIRVSGIKDGYHLEQAGAEHVWMDLKFSPETQEWSMITSGGESKIMKRLNAKKVLMYLPDNQMVEVDLSEEGLASFRDSSHPALSSAW